VAPPLSGTDKKHDMASPLWGTDKKNDMVSPFLDTIPPNETFARRAEQIKYTTRLQTIESCS